MKKVVCMMMMVLLTVLFCLSAAAASSDLAVEGRTIITDANWGYEKIDNGYQIVSYIGESDTAAIPYTYAKQYVTTIGEHAFDNNSVLRNLTLTPVTEIIEEYAFYSCTSLEKLTLFSSTDEIGVGAFYGCTALKDINLEDSSITAVPAYCFAESGIEELALPESCLSIGNMAFYNCSGLSKLTIPDSVTSIHADAFKGCDNVVIYCYTASYAREYAEANGIEYVLLDESVTFICGDADGDGEITIVDATRIQRVLAQLDEDPDGMIALRGDSDEDGLYITDATMIQRYLASYSITAPVGETLTRPKPVVNA